MAVGVDAAARAPGNSNNFIWCAAGPAPESQQTALLLLKGVLDPSASLLPNWDARVPVCSWAGLSCNTMGQVTNM